MAQRLPCGCAGVRGHFSLLENSLTHPVERQVTPQTPQMPPIESCSPPSDVTMDVACSSDGVRILSWRSSGTWQAGGAAPLSTERVTQAVAELAGMVSGRTLVYELHHRVAATGWEPVAMQLLGEVKPPDDGTEEHEGPERSTPTTPSRSSLTLRTSAVWYSRLRRSCFPNRI